MLGKLFGAVKGFLGKGGPLATVVGIQTEQLKDKEAERIWARGKAIRNVLLGIAAVILALGIVC